MSNFRTLDDVAEVTTIKDESRNWQCDPIKEIGQKLPCANTSKLGKELYKAFDLEAYRVRKLVLECEAGKIPTVTITRFVTVEEAERLGQIEPIE